jgi:hypothetical protein
VWQRSPLNATEAQKLNRNSGGKKTTNYEIRKQQQSFDFQENNGFKWEPMVCNANMVNCPMNNFYPLKKLMPMQE